MSIYVALLRGVNVGGANRLPMADLRRIATECGFADVQTYVQSGNVVFSSPDGAEASGSVLHDAVLAATGVDSAITVRSRNELEKIIAGNPFPEPAAADPTRVHVTFLFAPARDLGIDAARYEPEEAVLSGRELYLHLPAGLGRSKLATDLARRQDLAGTTRNWRTVTTLLDMARAAG